MLPGFMLPEIHVGLAESYFHLDCFLSEGLVLEIRRTSM